MKKNSPICLLFLLLAVSGCQKYNKLPFVNNPAYLRVFNDITTTPTIYNNGNLNNFLTFILDPTTDKSGIPTGGTIVGDFLGTRQLYTISYPTDAANTIAVTGNINYEYPGRAHVLTAPAINGFDCSSWAQIPGGTHRVMFVARPSTSVPFDSLSDVNRSRVLIDTTLDFSSGELYTIAAVVTNLGSNTYAAYIRQEEFIHNSYSPDSLYVAVYNLSAGIGGADIDQYSHTYHPFTDSLTVSGAAYLYDYVYKTFDSVPGAYPTAPLYDHFSVHGSVLALPRPPQSDFFDAQGDLGSYGYSSDVDPSEEFNNYSPALFGTLPCVTMQINVLAGGQYNVYFWTSPVGYNETFGNGPRAGFEFLPNLNLVAGLGNQLQVYPTFNIVEILNDRILLSQVQNGFNNTPQ